MNFLDYSSEFPFINFVKSSRFGFAGTATSTDIDANGYSKVNTLASGGGLMLPSSSDKATYVITWTGEGTVDVGNAGTWTEDAGLSHDYTRLANGRYSGVNPYIVATLSGYTFQAGGTALNVLATNPASNNNHIRDLKVYLLEDEPDLLAGKIFRTGWKQLLVNLNPAAIRFLNWTGGAASTVCRWSHRMPADNSCYNWCWQKSPPYAASGGTAQDVTVAAAAGMPVSMQHGEMAQFKVTTAIAGPGLGDPPIINSITKEATPLVTTAAAHNLLNGQKVVFVVGDGTSSMHQLHRKVATITSVPSATTFQINVDTSSFDDFGSGPGRVTTHTTLNVGGRGAYPVLGNKSAPITYFWNEWLPTGYGIATAVFDKHIMGDRDLGLGAWITWDASTEADFYNDCGHVPPEICVALVNELNEMKSGGEAIDCWITVPHQGLLSVDPDYLAADNYAVNMADVCLNGAGGYSGLVPEARLWVEFSNETWNGPFVCATYLAVLGQLRFGGLTTPHTGGSANYSGYSVLRAMVMHQDLLAAFPTEYASGRLRIVAAGQGTFGMVNGSGSPNDFRVNGFPALFTDPWNEGGTAPWEKFDAFAWASYFEPSDGSGDFSVYLDSIDQYAADFAAATGNATAQEAVCADWVVNVLRPRGEGTDAYIMKMGQFASVLAGKCITIQYEGGYQFPTRDNPTTAIDNFMIGVQRSAAWAAEQVRFFEAARDTPNMYMPSVYILVTGLRGMWGYIEPHVTTFLGGVEGGALNQTWTEMGTFNDSIG